MLFISTMQQRRTLPTLLSCVGLLMFCTCAWSQISLVHVTACGGPVAFPTTVCTVPSTGAGNLLVIGWASTAAGGADLIAGITDNAGNTYSEAAGARALDSTLNNMGDVWYAKNSVAGATSITITPNPSGASGTALIWEFSGLDKNSPLDQASTLNSQPTSTTPSGAPITVAANELILSIAWVQNFVTGIASGNVFTNDSLATGDGWAHYVSATPGTYTAQWNGEQGTYASSTVSFKAVAAGASACDLNDDGVVNVVDVQLAVDVDLGTLACPADLAGACTSSLPQEILNAALGEGCSITVNHSVTLNWVGSSSAAISGYNVYRGNTSGGAYAKINTSLVTTTSYTDGAVTAGQTYYYVTTAVNASGQESTYSNQAQVTVPTT